MKPGEQVSTREAVHRQDQVECEKKPHEKGQHKKRIHRSHGGVRKRRAISAEEFSLIQWDHTGNYR